MHAWAEVCRLSQSSKSLLTGFPSSGWWITAWYLFKHRVNSGWQSLSLHVSMHTDHISSSAMLSNNYDSLLQVLFKRLRKQHRKWSHSYSVSGLNFLVRLESCAKVVGWYTALCRMLLFCAKVIMKESIFKPIWRRRKEENILTVDDFQIQHLCDAFCTTRHVVAHEDLKMNGTLS